MQKVIAGFIICVAFALTPLFAQKGNAGKFLKVSDNGRFLVQQDGMPFFYLGDTAWELFHRLNREEVTAYLDNRKAKGFTVIQAVVLAELDGLHTPNAMGDLPLKNDDPTRPNEAYFKYVDWVINMAAERGIYIGLLPTWGDKLLKAWGVGPEIFNVENAKVYGTFIGKRYRKQWNIIWILGGDRNPKGDEHVAVWRSMAKGIEEGTGGPDKALITFHPQPAKPGGSSNWFHKEDWLDFNMHQTGHCRDGIGYKKIANDYDLLPVKPTMDGEPIYEEHPVCFKPVNGFANAWDLRKKAYWHVFYGAHGHTYGCAAVWQMYDKGREGLHGPLRTWRESLDLPGAQQMVYIKNLMMSRPFLTRIPDQSLIQSSNPADSLHASATRDADGTYMMVYIAGARPVTINMEKLKGTQFKAWWFDPRTGKAQVIGKMPKTPTLEFIPPIEKSPEDWVLVIDDMAAGFAPPGKTIGFP